MRAPKLVPTLTHRPGCGTRGRAYWHQPSRKLWQQESSLPKEHASIVLRLVIWTNMNPSSFVGRAYLVAWDTCHAICEETMICHVPKSPSCAWARILTCNVWLSVHFVQLLHPLDPCVFLGPMSHSRQLKYQPRSACIVNPTTMISFIEWQKVLEIMIAKVVCFPPGLRPLSVMTWHLRSNSKQTQSKGLLCCFPQDWQQNKSQFLCKFAIACAVALACPPLLLPAFHWLDSHFGRLDLGKAGFDFRWGLTLIQWGTYLDMGGSGSPGRVDFHLSLLQSNVSSIVCNFSADQLPRSVHYHADPSLSYYPTKLAWTKQGCTSCRRPRSHSEASPCVPEHGAKPKMQTQQRVQALLATNCKKCKVLHQVRTSWADATHQGPLSTRTWSEPRNT